MASAKEELMKRLVTIYVRKSRLKGDDEMEIERQIELLVKYAEDNNMDYRIFSEEGSSEDWNRPKLQEMLKELESGIYDGVLVTEQDRISRDDTDIGLFKRFCRKHDLLFFTLNKTYNFMDDDDNFITGVQAVMDSHFMRILKRKMLRGRIQALQSGVYFGVPPFGYEKSKTKPKILVRNESEAKAIEMIFDMYVNKKFNQTEIADKINLLGYKTREGKPFTQRSISIILENVAYIGTLLYELHGREPIIKENAHEALISKELFDEAQVIRRKNRIVPQQSKKGRYMLSNLIKCPKCGTRLSFCMKYVHRESRDALKKEERVLYVLNCFSSRSQVMKKIKPERCENLGIKAYRIEEAILNDLKRRYHDLEVEISILMEEEKLLMDDVSHKIGLLEERLKQLDKQRVRVQNGYKDGIYNSDEAKKELQKIEDQKAEVEIEKSKAEKMNATTEIDKKKKMMETITEILSGEYQDVTIINEMLKEVISTIYYYKEKADNRVQHPFYLEIEYKQ